jgi:hypothetical protein
MCHFSIGLVAFLNATAVPAQNFCSSAEACYTPARGANCPPVRFGWGNCPGSKQACDWCYGPSGVFAYTPRGSVYTLGSGCNNLGSNATWATKDPQTVQWMTKAGGSCSSDGRGGYNCVNVDAGKFKQAANCQSEGELPAPSTPSQDLCTGTAACYTPARGPSCPPVRFGWGNCPGSKQACDWCYSPSGVFAYVPRGSVYTLDSGCKNIGSNATWTTKDPPTLQLMKRAGGSCSPNPQGGYACTNVDAGKFKEGANCSSSAK